MDSSKTKSHWKDIVSAFPILCNNKEVSVLNTIHLVTNRNNIVYFSITCITLYFLNFLLHYHDDKVHNLIKSNY